MRKNKFYECFHLWGIKIFFSTLLLLSLLYGQQLPEIVVTKEMQEVKELPMHSVLYDLDKTVRSNPGTELMAARKLGLIVREDGKVNVEIVSETGTSPIDTIFLSRFGGEVDAVWQNRVSAWVPSTQMIALAKALPKGIILERANVPLPVNEGPGLVNSDGYRDGGANGTGINVGIIDGGFQLLNNAVANGAAPANWVEVNYTGQPFQSGGVHGTACVETVFDHAPAAQYFLYKIENLTHLGNAVNHAIQNNVDIISHSLAWYNLGWDDNTGGACVAVSNATNNNILFFTAAGNYAENHWQGNFNGGLNSPNWHDWSVGGDETINVFLNAMETFSIYLSWNTSGGTYDYDLYLYDSNFNVLASSTNGGNSFEAIIWANGIVGQTVHLAVWRSSGGNTEFELFSHYGNWQEHEMAWSSTVSPVNSTEPNCISVGAVSRFSYNLPPGSTNLIESYSSQGPTNSGALAPDMCAPTGTTTIAYNGGFGGTSCATPNAAGAAAALWSSRPLFTPSVIRHLFLDQARIFRDWGTSGADNIYGYGGATLTEFHINTVWVDLRIPNPLGLPFFPYNYVSHAQNAAISGGRVLFLGQSYPEIITLDKILIYETIGTSAIIGPQ